MNLMITGSRKITNPEIIKNILNNIGFIPDVIIHGGASGVDTLVQGYFSDNIFTTTTVVVGAKTQDHIKRELGRLSNQAVQKGCINSLIVRPRYSHSNDRSAPLYRNSVMAKLLDPKIDKGLVIWVGEEKSGTYNAMNELLKRNIETFVYTVKV